MSTVGMTLRRKYPDCPRCGSLLYLGNDGFEKYLTCLTCSREFGLDMRPRIMTREELFSRYGVGLTKQKKYVNMSIE